MTHPFEQPDDPIDAVITWVDGAAPEHRRQREFHAAQAGKLHENAINPHRWVDSNEILFCLQSIENHAPWIRLIWLVTDGTKPDLSRLSTALRAKVRYVSHAQIFGEFDDALPTFNSLAIESLLWRIAGLTERFLYFNDDVFLTAPLVPEDVFREDRVVLRGRWMDFGALIEDPSARDDPAVFNHFMQINAAGMLGYAPSHIFEAAHVVHPVWRSVMADAFARNRQAFVANIGHRFRDLRQFLPQSLHNHACITAGRAIFQTRPDHLHVYSGQGVDSDPDELRRVLQVGLERGPKFLCVNDLPQLEGVIPEARAWITAAIGGFADSAD